MRNSADVIGVVYKTQVVLTTNEISVYKSPVQKRGPQSNAAPRVLLRLNPALDARSDRAYEKR